MASRIPLQTIQKVKQLRSQGWSLPEISKELKLSKTSVLRYIKGVEILPEFLSQWAGKRGGSNKYKLFREKKALEEMQNLINELSSKEKLLIISALYWAEGEKKDFSISNTDPHLIRVFVNALRELFGLNNERFRLSIRIYEDLDPEKCIEFWSQVTNLPRENIISIIVLPGKKKGKLEYGMCRVRITRGGDLLKKIKAVGSIITQLSVPIAQMDRASRS